jgi:FkbM family methyltransferase
MITDQRLFRLTTTAGKCFLTNPNDSYVGKSLEVYGEWSHGEILLFEQLLNASSNVVEVGANIGAHTVFIAKDICRHGSIYAFEPRRIYFQMLCTNLMLNAVTNVWAYQQALGRESKRVTEGQVPLATTSNQGAIPIGTIPIGTIPGRGEVIDVVRLDDMLAELARVSLLKADVEGWEIDVLEGSRGLIDRDRPIIYIENDRIDRSTQLLTYVQDLNYDMWWHIVRLYRSDNFANTKVNIFGNVASFNVLCIPKEKKVRVDGLRQVDDVNWHPLNRPANG